MYEWCMNGSAIENSSIISMSQSENKIIYLSGSDLSFDVDYKIDVYQSS